MTFPSFSVGEVLTASDMNAVGLWRVTPTSVAGTGVALSGGVVTFTNATSIIVNGCFTNNFRNYKLIIDCGGAASGGANITLRMRNAGVTTTGTGYYWNGVNQNAAAAPINHSAVNSTSFYVTDVLNAVADSAYIETTILSPQRTSRTGYISTTAFEYGTDYYYRSVAGQFTTSASYDGFNILSNTTGITGRLSIYGYNQS